MKVELSERSRKTVESLVEGGTYPTVEAAAEAAIEPFDADWDGIDVARSIIDSKPRR